jgi:urea transport system permease protein
MIASNPLPHLNTASKHHQPTLYKPKAWAAILLVICFFAVLPVLNLSTPENHDWHVSNYTISLLGKFICFALAALALDLVWGYTGILSLGHGLFFALGGYAHGMYLMRAAKDSSDQLPDFMVFFKF